jgi:predicted amidohydrolase YtcJ
VFEAFGALAHRAGCTTVADLGGTFLSDPSVLEALASTTARPDFPVRLSMFHLAAQGPHTAEKEVALVDGLVDRSTEKLRFGHVKLILDGSVQGFTARLQPPGYLGDRPNGMWVTAPERLRETFLAFHEAGRLVHAHCNGDEATELFLDVVAHALSRSPRWDHRHTVTHSQLSTPAQYRRMAALGVGANIFANHTYFWGDQHRDITVGPDRAARMNAAATALAAGVTISLHSDEPVTPIGPLPSMANAVERRTASGAVLGPDEAITAAQALEAVTLGSARLLKMDHEIGSIEGGKLADFAVLDDDPLTVPPDRIRHLSVVATVLGGRVLPNEHGAMP